MSDPVTPKTLTVREIADLFHRSNNPDVVRACVVAIGADVGGVFCGRSLPSQRDQDAALRLLCEAVNALASRPWLPR